jgi:hypothetical protein
VVIVTQLTNITSWLKTTHGVLQKQDDWFEWQQLDFLQLNQYELQHMFGDPLIVLNGSAVFTLVWTYVVRRLIDIKRCAGHAMDPPVVDRSECLIFIMPTVLITHVLAYLMHLLRQKTCSFFEPMLAMLLLKHLYQN